MSEKPDKPAKGEKPAAKKTADVDALLTEVASAAKLKPAAAKAAPKAAEPAPAPKPAEAAQKKTLRVRQVRSGICAPVDQKRALVGLGLRGIRKEAVLPDTPSVRGQILKVRHLVTVVGE